MVFIVEMAWGRPHEVISEGGYDRDDNYIPTRLYPDPDPDPEWRCFSCHASVWKDVLKLAQEHGWVPAGTVPDERSPKEWEKSGFDSSYDPVDWLYIKQVTAADAAAMASALEKAIDAHPVPATVDSPQPLLIREGMTSDEFANANRGMSKEFLSEFFTFLRKGQFRFAYDD